MPEIIGTDNDDTLVASSGDTVFAGRGNDTITMAGGGAYGQDGDDTFVLTGTQDNPAINGGAGFDTLQFVNLLQRNPDGGQWRSYGLYVDPVTQEFDLNIQLRSSQYGPVVSQSWTRLFSIERVVIGSDLLFVSMANLTRGVEFILDTPAAFIGGAGADTIYGGTRGTTITVGDADRVYGEGGNDTLILANGVTTALVDGGNGFDVLSFSVTGTQVFTATASGTESGSLSFRNVEEYNISASSGLQSLTMTLGDTDERFVYAPGLHPASASIDISGGGGNDTLVAGQVTNSILRGGDGNDVIEGSDRLFGDAGNDQITYQPFANRTSSGAIIDGGAGDDQIIYRPLEGQTPSGFAIHGGDGVDSLVLAERGARATFVYDVSLTTGRLNGTSFTSGTGATGSITGFENVRGYLFDDVIEGDGGANTLQGDGGNDRLYGRGGNDRLEGGVGNDLLDGGEGDDVLFGEAGNDTLDGGAGFDTAVYSGTRGSVTIQNVNGVIEVRGPEGTDRLTGIEALQFSDGVFDLRADGSLSQNGRFVLYGSAAADTLVGGDSHDALYGNDGADVLTGGQGDDTVDGGAGIDTAVFSAASTQAAFSYVGNTIVVDGPNGRDVLTGIEQLRFSDRVLDVGADGRVITALNTVNGTAAADVLTGTAGSDALLGGGGNDRLQGLGGSDVLNGGEGVDAAVYSGVRRQYASSSTSVSGGPEGGTDTLISIEEQRFVDGGLTFDVDSTAAQIMRLYDATLDRQPDQAGLEFQTRAVSSGAYSLVQVASAFVASPEFQNRYGALSNQQFVEQLYRFCLDREGDPAGIAVQVNALDTGTSRAQLVVNFSESNEHRGLTAPTLNAGLWLSNDQALQVARLYDATFDRLPDVEGLTSQLAALNSGVPLLTLAANFAASAEFQARYGALSNQQFVEQLYRFCLNREGDASGIAVQVNALNNGTSRAQILLNFSESAEHVALTAPSWSGGIRYAGYVGAAPLEDVDGKHDVAQVSPLMDDVVAHHDTRSDHVQVSPLADGAQVDFHFDTVAVDKGPQTVPIMGEDFVQVSPLADEFVMPAGGDGVLQDPIEALAPLDMLTDAPSWTSPSEEFVPVAIIPDASVIDVLHKGHAHSDWM